MLTIGRREDGRKGLGFEFAVERGATMAVEDNELEEGEACSSQDEYSCIDPDSLSYIDKKIQDVLGHFQKDFEGGVSVENLGAKFGGYGSFLPTYQRSPILYSQSRTSPKLANHHVAQSPYNPPCEGTRQTTSLTASTSNFRSNTIMAQRLDNSAKKDICINTNHRESISQHNTYNKPTTGNDPSSLKVRLKVGPENNFSRDNAAIYTGLGLDMSPSSSYEDSPDGSRGISPEFHCLYDESPKTIIQVMTCFSIPGGYLLSPLQDSLLQLMQKNDSFLKKYKGHEGISENGIILAQLTLPVFKNDAPMTKKIKLGERKGRLMELQDSKGKVAIRKLDIEVPEGQESKSCKIPELSGSRSDDEEAERLIVGYAVKSATKIWDNVGASNLASVNDRITSPDLATDKQADIAENIESEEPVSADAARHFREKLISKSSKTIKMSGAPTTDSQMNDSFCPQRDGSSKFDKDFGLSKMNSQSSGQKKRNNGSYDSPSLKNISTELDALHDIGGTKESQIKDDSSNRKRKAKACHSTTEPLIDLSKDNCSGNSSAAFREQKKCTYTTGHHAEKNIKDSKLHKESDGVNFRSSCEGNQVKQPESSFGSLNKPKHKVIKNRSGKELPVSSQNFKEKCSSKRAESTLNSGAYVNEQTSAPLISNAPDTVAALTAPAPIVIEENWVCCDLCQKWRLLPYGTNPDSLPKKWQCRLLDWLPGMNSCHVSEDETTKALNALYTAPAPEYHNGIGALQPGQTIELGTQIMHATGKKISFPKDVPSLLCHSTLAEPINSAKKNYQAPMNYTNISDANHYAYETKSSSKNSLGNSLKSINIGAEKHKQKQKKHKSNAACYSDGGDLTDKNLKYPKSRGEKEFHQDDLREYMKSKKENMLNSNKDYHSIDTPTEKFFHEGTAGCLTSTKVTLHNQPGDNKFHLAKDSNSNLNAKLSPSSKKSLKLADMKEHIFGHDAEISGNQVIPKKRKVRDWQESQGIKETKVTDQNMAARIISEGYFSGNDQAKENKAKLPKSEGKCSGLTKIEGKTGKKGSKIRTILPVNGDFLPDAVHHDVQYDIGKEDELTQCKGTDNFQRVCEFDSLKRDLSYADASAAANSSSSKVSGSHRSKTCHQDAKGSPVESVSSSPFRICNMDTLMHKKQAVQKDDAINGTSSARDIKRGSNTEIDGDIDRCTKGRQGLAFKEKKRSCGNSREGNEPLTNEFGDVYLTGDNRNAANHQGKHIQEGSKKNDIQVIESLSKHHSLVKSSKQRPGKSSSGSRERERIYKSDLELDNHKVSSFCRDKKDSNSAKNDIHSHFEKDIGTSEPLRILKFQDKKIENTTLGKKDSTSSWLTARQIDNLAFTIQENKDASNAFAFRSQPKDLDSLVPVAGDRSIKSSLQVEFQMDPSYLKEKIQQHSSADRGNHPELPSAPGRSQLNLLAEDKSSLASSSLKLSRSDIYAVEAVIGEATKAVKQLRQPDVQNVLHHNNLRHAAPNGPDASSPIRKDVHLATSAVMREARDLKHTANRLKNEGLELESTGLYFEAALKFLHVASLMEPLNFDNTKQDAAQMYSDTAKLCQYVAHEYEKLKDMAAAALAHKCVEVAYLKAAYYKNPNVSKDRHDVQTALQTLPPGESPSSSASDVDNVNNQATIFKIASAKGVSSPQVPSSNTIAARLHPQILRLLQYTNDLNSAFEATRKSQGAIAAASVSIKKENMDGLSSVREVLDFSFHDVEGLLRLLRISKESISR